MKSCQILLAIGLFLVIVVLFGGAYFVSKFRHTQAEVSPLAEKVFDAIDSNTLAVLYDELAHPALRNVTSREQVAQLGEIFDSRLGRIRSKRLLKSALYRVNSSMVSQFAYQAIFDKGRCEVRIGFEHYEGRWLLRTLNVESPVFIEALALERSAQKGTAEVVAE